jgi:hypothetical protein
MSNSCDIYVIVEGQTEQIFSMHEIEALYFSNPAEPAQSIGVNKTEIDAILHECGEPEKINDSSATAPSKRLESLSTRFKKTSTGVAIAKDVGIDAMRTACPLFHQWITRLEACSNKSQIPSNSEGLFA